MLWKIQQFTHTLQYGGVHENKKLALLCAGPGNNLHYNFTHINTINTIYFSGQPRWGTAGWDQLNECADALSRNQLTSFFSLTPQAEWQQIPSTLRVGERACQAEQLDVSSLGQAVQHYLKCSLAPSTYMDLHGLTVQERITTSNSAQRRTITINRIKSVWICSPLAQGDMEHQSIKCYLSATHHLQVT